MLKTVTSNRRGSECGFSLMEIVVIVAITLLTSAIVVPVVGSAINSYRARSAASSVGSAIQSTRYRAIAAGYAYQVAFSRANSNYLIQSDPNSSGNFANIPAAENGGPGPFSLSGSSVNASIAQDITLSFSPSGAVRSTTGGATVNCGCQFTVTYNNTVETITVSLYGIVQINP